MLYAVETLNLSVGRGFKPPVDKYLYSQNFISLNLIGRNYGDLLVRI